MGRSTALAGLVALCVGLATGAQAQVADLDALIDEIDARSGQYTRLLEILQGTDTTRALAAFDVMVDAGDKTLAEVAINGAMTATDARLRARALWETLVQKDAVALEIETDALDTDARTALDAWIGPLSTWSITARSPETQCLNLYRTGACDVEYHLSVSGLKVDFTYKAQASGSFALNPEGVLMGQVVNPSTKAVYPARIQLR